jgi:hypothetical protein
MENQKTAKKNLEKKNQPSYGDKPWQNPQYGQKDSTKDSPDDCGCGSDKDNKKETAKRH